MQVEFSLDGIALQYGEKAEFVFRDIQLDSQARFRSLLVTGLTNELDVFGFSFSRAVENRQFFIW